MAKIEGKGAKTSPCPLVSPAPLLSGQKKMSRPTFLRHLTYMDIKVAASGLSDHQTWSRNLFEFVFAIQLESFLCTFNSCIALVVIIKVATAISLAASTDSNHFWIRNKVQLVTYTRSFDRTCFASNLAKIEGKGAKAPPCPLVSSALLLSGLKKTSHPTFWRHLTYVYPSQG